MMDNKEKFESEKYSNERDYISCLFHNQELVAEHVEGALKIDFFEDEHKVFLRALSYAYDKGILLTEKIFKDYLKKIGLEKIEIMAQNTLYAKISLNILDENEYIVYREKVLENYIKRKSIDHFFEYEKNTKNGSSVYAAKKLADQMAELTETSEHSNHKIIYSSVKDLSVNFLKTLDGKIDNPEVAEKNIIKTGIADIDYILTVGLHPGTMTLFCGEPGGFKSTMMMNIGLNVWKGQGRNVLYVPLEMPWDLCYCKMISRETKIPFDNFILPSLIGVGLSNEDKKEAREKMKKKVHDEVESWAKDDMDGRFWIMETASERTKVSTIRRHIEKNVEAFQPDLVIVDYIANLMPDTERSGRNDLEITDMINDLRAMGSGEMGKGGFSIVSGAQIGREGLKRFRKNAGEGGFNSEDLHGSHGYGMEADNVFAQMIDTAQPNQRLLFMPIKGRYSKKTFANGEPVTSLLIQPDIGLIDSVKPMFDGANSSSILTTVGSVIDDNSLDFDDEDDGIDDYEMPSSSLQDDQVPIVETGSLASEIKKSSSVEDLLGF